MDDELRRLAIWWMVCHSEVAGITSVTVPRETLERSDSWVLSQVVEGEDVTFSIRKKKDGGYP